MTLNENNEKADQNADKSVKKKTEEIKITDKLDIHEQIDVKVREKSSKKPTVELKQGDSLSKKNGKYNHIERKIDRKENTYSETIKDPERGEIIHQCNEPLNEHTGHGSDEHKKKQRSGVKMTETDNMYSVKYGAVNLSIRRQVIADYWVLEGLLYADEYYPLKVSKNDVVLDVGANIGIFTCKLASKVNRVIAIEPEPSNFSTLTKNVKQNNFSNVNLLNLAVSDKIETVHFNDTGGTAKVEPNGIPVEAKSLDSILDDLGNPRVTILKMDVEGYEEKILSVFKQYNTIQQVIIETHSKELTDSISSILQSWGFIVKDVSRIKRTKVVKNIIYHPFCFFKLEKINGYNTIKQSIRYVTRRGSSPVAADNKDSGQRILYGFIP